MSNFAGKTFIFLGISGSGKGIQTELLEKWLTGQGYSLLRVVLGDKGRQLAEKASLLGRWVNGILKRGGFFPSWLVFNLLLNTIDEELISPEQILIIDGGSRRLPEAKMIDELLQELGRSPAQPIYLEVSEDEARQRLTKRGRDDDQSPAAVNSRFDWFKKETLLVLDYYGNRLIKINGQQSIEAVHDAVKKAIGN